MQAVTEGPGLFFLLAWTSFCAGSLTSTILNMRPSGSSEYSWVYPEFSVCLSWGRYVCPSLIHPCITGTQEWIDAGGSIPRRLACAAVPFGNLGKPKDFLKSWKLHHKLPQWGSHCLVHIVFLTDNILHE